MAKGNLGKGDPKTLELLEKLDKTLELLEELDQGWRCFILLYTNIWKPKTILDTKIN